MTVISTSRRELNKERTRRSIRTAVLVLARTHSITEITADDIATTAGVSRRTFFNYYGGLDAVLAEATLEPLLGVAERFLARPAGEEPLAALIAAFEGSIPLELARWSAALCSGGALPNEVYARVMHLHTQWLQELISTRLGDETDPLYVAGLAGTVIAAFSAAEASWLTSTTGRLDAPSRDLFATLVRTTLGHARDGWRAPHTPSCQTPSSQPPWTEHLP